MKVKNIIALFFTLFRYNYSFSIHHEGGLKLAGSESVLDPKGEIALKWRVDYGSEKIHFHLEFSEKTPSIKWFALGFSDRGHLEKSDVCLFWTDYTRVHFEDMHADKNGKLIRDKHQNCESFHVDHKTRRISFERYFDTCDKDDYLIEDGTIHVIWAKGTDTLFTSNGLCISCTSAQDHGFIRVRLLSPPPTSQPHTKELRITTNDVKVPVSDTTYWCKVVKLPEFVTTTEHHIIKFESTIPRGNEGLVHHMEVYYCDDDPKKEISMYEGSCFSPDRPKSTSVCVKVKAAWAMGASAFLYPEEAGLPLGGSNANKYVMLEIHYNNPELRNDWVDSSGIILQITANKRKYDAAIMELGMDYTDRMAIPGGQETFPLTSYCVPECTRVGLPSTGITVFGSQLHTHTTGVAVWTRHSRGGRELHLLNRDMHYSTHFQEIRILHRPVKVLPGDYLETTCIYNTKDKENATISGHAITDEMCINYIHYYPATDLGVCKSSVSLKALNDYFKFEKRCDNTSISFTTSPRDNYGAIKPWTPQRVKMLHKLYSESPVSVDCIKSNGNRFQGDWEEIHIPKIEQPLSEKPRNCFETVPQCEEINTLKKLY